MRGVSARELANDERADNLYRDEKTQKRKEKAQALEEQAGELRREGKRLMAEAMQMDEELAREMQEGEVDRGRHWQVSGVAGRRV